MEIISNNKKNIRNKILSKEYFIEEGNNKLKELLSKYKNTDNTILLRFLREATEINNWISDKMEKLRSSKRNEHFMVEDDIARQIKKDNSDIPNENYLETQRNITGEENKLGSMPVGVIPLNDVDTQSAENELTNNEVKDGI